MNRAVPSHASKPHEPTPCVGCSTQHVSSTLGVLTVLDKQAAAELTDTESYGGGGHHALGGNLASKGEEHVGGQTSEEPTRMPRTHRCQPTHATPKEERRGGQTFEEPVQTSRAQCCQPAHGAQTSRQETRRGLRGAPHCNICGKSAEASDSWTDQLASPTQEERVSQYETVEKESDVEQAPKVRRRKDCLTALQGMEEPTWAVRSRSDDWRSTVVAPTQPSAGKAGVAARRKPFDSIETPATPPDGEIQSRAAKRRARRLRVGSEDAGSSLMLSVASANRVAEVLTPRKPMARKAKVVPAGSSTASSVATHALPSRSNQMLHSAQSRTRKMRMRPDPERPGEYLLEEIEVETQSLPQRRERPADMKRVPERLAQQ